MIRTSRAATDVITGSHRRFHSRASFEFLSLRRDTTVQIFAPNAAAGGVPDQIVEPEVPYYTDRLFIGTTAKNRVFPDVPNIHALGGWHGKRTTGKTRVGYIGAKADSLGNNNDYIAVRFTPRNIPYVTLQTGPLRFIADGVITVSNVLGDVLFEYILKDNSQGDLLIPCKAENASMIALTVTKSTPDRRLWILTFSPAVTSTYDDSKIIEYKHEIRKTQNRDGSIGRLYIQNLNLQIENKARHFDFANRDSPLHGMLRKGVELSVSLSLKDTDFDTQLGLFYADSWEASEDAVTASVSALCYLGLVKDDEVKEPLLDNTTVHECFTILCRRISLTKNQIPEELKNITLAMYSLQGKIGALLNDLCNISQCICYMSSAGDGLVVKRMPTIRGSARYPGRYFTTNEYVKSDRKTEGQSQPNIIKAEYTLSEYERTEIEDQRQVVMYSDLTTRNFPEESVGKAPPYEREIGAGELPSKTFTFTKPRRYVRTNITDPFIPEIFEFDIIDNDPENPDTITVKLWSFVQEDEDDQVTITIIKESTYKDILLETVSNSVLRMPSTYVAQIPGDTTEERNIKNDPQIFEVKLDGKFAISSIVPGNKFMPGKFEYTIEKTGAGCIIRVWNYLMYTQEFTVSLYGKRIIEGDDTHVITLRNEDAITQEGEIVKTITLNGVASDEIAQDLIRSTALFYDTFGTPFSIDTWADPRIGIGDLVANESLRGYGYTEGIIEEVSLTYKGGLSQKLKILETEKHNRDCRTAGGYVLGDRPVMFRTTEGYV
jgi:hypothetical protein